MASAPTTCGLHFRAENSPATHTEAFVPLDYRVDSTIAEDLSLTGKTTLHLRAGRRANASSQWSSRATSP